MAKLPLGNWVPVDKLQAFVRHGICVSAVLVLFKLVALLAQWTLKDASDIAQSFLHTIEELVMVGVVLSLAFELFILIWPRRSQAGKGLSSHVFA